MSGKSDLHGLIGSRICHDLISPLGAIGNGVELLTMSGITDMPEIALISESIENANARIRFFRIAFGSASEGARIGIAELKSILQDLYRGNRISVDWHVSEDVSRQSAKLVCLVILCLESALPYGGRISISRTGDRWHVTGSADRLKFDPALWDQIDSQSAPNDIAPSEVQFAMIGPTAREQGKLLQVQRSNESIAISF